MATIYKCDICNSQIDKEHLIPVDVPVRGTTIVSKNRPIDFCVGCLVRRVENLKGRWKAEEEVDV